MFGKDPALLILILLFCFLSCSKKSNKEDPPPPEKITFVVEDKYLPSGKLSWIFITDKNGISSEAKPVINGTTIEFELDDTIPEDQYTLNIFSSLTNNENETYLNMESFTEFSSGNYYLRNQVQQETHNTTSSHNFTINNVPFASDIFTSAFGKDVAIASSTYYSSHDWKINTEFSGNYANITYYGSINGQWKYYVLDSAANGENTSIDYTGMHNMENYVNYSFKYPGRPSCITYGINNDDYNGMTALNTSKNLTDYVTNLDYYYPTTSFDKYVTQVTLTSENIHQVFTNVGNAIAPEFKEWDGRILSRTQKDNELNIKLSKQAGIIHATNYVNSNEPITTYGRNVFCSWNITTSGSTDKTILLPTLPASFANQYPEWAINDFKFIYISTVNTDAADPYNNYLTNRFINNAPSILNGFLFPGMNYSIAYHKLF